MKGHGAMCTWVLITFLHVCYILIRLRNEKNLDHSNGIFLTRTFWPGTDSCQGMWRPLPPAAPWIQQLRGSHLLPFAHKATP